MKAKTVVVVVACMLLGLATSVIAQGRRYGPGVSDTEIKIGQTMPYSGPLSAYGAIGRAHRGFFEKVNAEGGINGRRVVLLSLDDGYNPAKIVEHVRKLLEHEQVLMIFGSVGTVPNIAVRKYLNAHRVPQLFIAGGDSAWADPVHFPWTMGWMPPYQQEAKLYARHILQTRPNARIAVLYANDDYGRDYVRGFKAGLGARAASMLVAEQSFEWSDPTVDTQIVTLKASGADTLFSAMGGKHASQALRRMATIGWRPVHYTGVPSASITAILEPAGLENAIGLVSAWYSKYLDFRRYQDDPAIGAYFAWAKQYYDGNPEDGNAFFGYEVAQALEYVLRQCGDNLTRENVMHVATSLKDVQLPLMLPGVRANTSPSDYQPIEQFQLMRFDGRSWEPIGKLQSPLQ